MPVIPSQIANRLSNGKLDTECRDLEIICREYFAQPLEVILASAQDTLGLGMHLFTDQWISGHKGHQVAAGTETMAASIIQQTAASSVAYVSDLNFRLYGALIGAQLTNDSSLRSMSTDIVSSFLDKELSITAEGSHHFAINKVMLAAALNPTAFKRMPDEEQLVF